MAGLPTGTVTLLFSDIAGSTALLARLGDRYADALDVHRDVLRSAWARWDGVEMGTEGDSFFVVFDVASHAVSASLQAQRELAACSWPEGGRLAVRIGMHTGEPAVHADGYVGMDVHLAARIAATAHGGQVVVSEATGLLVSERLDDEVRLLDLGRHRLKDIVDPQHIYQLSAPGLAHDFPPLKSLGTATSLPVPTTTLVGRDSELQELVALLVADRARLVTLTGPGGSGKTRLATAAAMAVVDAYPDGVYFVPLAAVTSDDAMWTSVAEVLGAAGEDRAKVRFLDWLRSRHVLVVVDNLEQLSGAAAVVGELLSAAHQITVIATSRRPLHLQGEHEYPVPPLGLPVDDGLVEAHRSEAVRLFCQHAQLVRPSFTLADDTVGDVVAVCQRLDGMPLAIELAAARVKLLSPAALLRRLDRTTDLAGQSVDRPERQQTLRAAIGWSYELLPEDLQGFFRRLGVFAGGADLDAVAAVTPQSPDTFGSITELVDASLVTVSDGPDGEPRIGMLQTIRDFALDQLDQTGELGIACRLHAVHYLALAETLRTQMMGDQPIAGRDRLDLEQDNMRAVLGWALDPDGKFPRSPDKVAVGLQMCHWLYYYWGGAGLAEGRRWHERALELAGDDDSEELAVVLLELAALQYSQGEYTESIELMTRALAIGRRIDFESGIVASLRTLGEVRTAIGELHLARELLTESLALATAQHDDLRIAWALADLGWLEYLADNLDLATAHTNQSLTLFEALGFKSSVVTARLRLATIHLTTGDVDQAASTLHQLAGDPVLLNEPQDRLNLVELYARLAAVWGNAHQAARLFGASGELRRLESELRDPSEEADLHRHLSEARHALGEPEWQQACEDGKALSLGDALTEAQSVHMHRT